SATSTAVNEGTANTISLAVSIGGGGGAGGKGNTVTVNNVGRIFTMGDDAPAIVAQSVGGGGGIGGAGVASSDTVGNINNFTPGNIFSPDPSSPPPDPDVPNSTDRAKLEQLANGAEEGTKIAVAVGVGGSGGAAGVGGDVSVTNDGNIVTYGYASQGIFAQSVGGGGGTAGGGSAQSSGNVAVGVGLGGNGGGAGMGGNINVSNTGTISTWGDDATAVFAQSVGGGGGLALIGDGHVGLNPKGVAVAIGGATGSSGAGGNMIVSQTGTITTIGDRSYGILAQSIGGGGGVGGTGDGINLGAVVVGGSGGAGGAGGTVQVTDSGGITTYGNGADGILAQSIGGGGGVGGDAAGSNPHLGSRAITVGVGVGGAAGEAGNGEGVTISSTGPITTSGIAAYGILAQSIGGGGGIGGSGDASGGTIAFAGSNGGAGSGGAITIDQTGNVTASGMDSHAIFAQSVGGLGGGNITINLHGGTISGGTGNAAGIYLDGGATNAINISFGAVVTAQSGVAIQATDGVDANGVAQVIGNTTVNNSGGIVGSVDLGSGMGQVNNLAGATFITGTTLNLGSGALVNAGRLDIGGVNNVITTALTGAFVQTTAGTYVADVRFGGTSDLLAVNSIANVRGTILPNLLSLLPNTPATILTASGGFVGVNDVMATNSSSVTYGVQFVGNSLQLVVTQAQFVNTSLSASLSPNELAVANQLQNIWNAGATPGIGPVFAALANLSDPQSYAQVLDRLHPAAYLAQPVMSTFTGLNFVDSMMSCHLAAGPFAPLTEIPCEWAKLTGSFANQVSSSGSSGFHDQAARLQAGRQIQLAPDWFGEFAVGYEAGRTTGNFATTLADRYDFGAALKHQIGPWLFAAALDVGYDALNTTREIGFAGVQAATSTPSVWRLDSRFRAAYVAEFGNAYVKPSLDLDVIYTALPGFSEAGAGPLNLNVASSNKVAFAASPMVELGQTYFLANGSALRPFVQGGATLLSNNTWSVNSTFESAPAGVAPFTTLTSLPQTLWKVSTGIDIFSVARIPGLDLRLEYQGRFGPGYNDQTGLVKLSRHF
ncbi:MAG: autotransporter domain-containing protein, partial [Bradyrhizobium sp.]